MWNMMCDVMPTIAEDSISQRGSQFSGDDANFEQLMVSMLDERDKLLDTIRETQERLSEIETKYQELEKERDSLQRQLDANLPQVSNMAAILDGSGQGGRWWWFV
ncbi:liprin-alpha-2-like [Penaeus monodon]|uniref:liprin-alpha-2-like n=1 Tax=Penaeus monodon TaxID=6687 RepID=UPI0018A7A69E|nr:liprin-alpha-2-like [Penaeus monodon]